MIPITFTHEKGVVYFVKRPGTTQYKIGQTTNFIERFAHLKRDEKCELEVVHIIESDNHVETERLFHQHFITQQLKKIISFMRNVCL